MSEFFMGQLLSQPELPANSPRPPETPEEGVIVVDQDADGYTRRYLYTSMNGSQSEVMISETPTAGVSARAVMVEAEPEYAVSMAQAAPIPARIQASQRQTSPVLKMGQTAPQMGVHMQMPGVEAAVVSPQRPVMASAMPSIQKIQVAPMAEAQRVPAVQVQQSYSPRIGESVQMPGQGRSESVVISQRPVMASTVQAPSAVQATPLPQIERGVPMVQIQTLPAPRMGAASLAAPTPSVQLPVTRSAPIPVDDNGVMTPKNPVQASRALGGPTSFLEGAVRLHALGGPSLGQVPQKNYSPGVPLGVYPAQAGAVPAAPAQAPAPEVGVAVPGECPGAVEMPDGSVIEPEHNIRLKDLCELMPFLLESYAEMQKAAGKGGPLAPGQQVPIAGQVPGGAGAVPSSSSQFSPGRGGGGGGFGGGGGSGAPGPQGLKGEPGIPGTPGLGGATDTITKTDGDFAAGPGAFIPVPGTLITFTQAADGPATFLLNATLGTVSGASGASQNGQIGIKIDGTDYPLASRLLHTFAGGVGEFLIGQSVSHIMTLLAGSHTVEVILRGFAPGEIGGAALGSPLSVAADPIQPLSLSVIHN